MLIFTFCRVPVHNSRSPSVSSVDTSPPTRQNSRNRTASDTSVTDITSKDHNSLGSTTNSVLHSQSGRTLDKGVDNRGNVQSSSDGLKPSVYKLPNIKENGAVTDVSLNNNAETSQTGLKTELNGSNDEVSSEGDVFLDPIEPRVPTFFSVMGTR